MLNKKNGYVVSCLCLLFVLSGCQGSVATSAVMMPGIVKQGAEQMRSYDSPYTYCTKNRDGTFSTYIFSAPVQYKTEDGYRVIDNSIVSSQNQRFRYQNKANNIKTYFPNDVTQGVRLERDDCYLLVYLDDMNLKFSQGKLNTIVNLYGTSVQAITYNTNGTALHLYPTASGIRLELVLASPLKGNSIQFYVETGENLYDNAHGQYLVFLTQKGNKKGVIQAPLAKGSSGRISINNSMETQYDEDKYKVAARIDQNLLKDQDQYPIRIDIPIEIYTSKMPDTSVYSNYSENSYLKQYAAVGLHPELGEGWECFRLRMNYFIPTKPDSILGAFYSAKVLDDQSSGGEIQMFQPEDQWSSTQMVWKNRISAKKEQIGRPSVKHGYLCFDITDLAKACYGVHGSSIESVGGMLKKNTGSGYYLISTSDNSLYPSYIRIDLKKAPNYFTPKDEINNINDFALQ